MKQANIKNHARLCGALLLGLSLTLGTMTLTAGAANVMDVTATLSPQIQIVIDGKAQTFFTATGKVAHPISYNGTTYLPIRAIGEWMGKNVNWDQSTLTATLSGTRSASKATGNPNQVVTQQPLAAQIRQDFIIVVDGTVRSFTDATGAKVYPLLYDGSIYLPVRAIAELMGCTVSWNGESATVTLQSGAATGGLVTDADQFQQTQTGSTTTTGYIGEAKAKEIALQHAGLTASQVTFLRAQLETDDGRRIYDVEFYTKDNKEYDYEIDAKTGTILNVDYDAEHAYLPNTTPNNTTANIGAAQAKSIALSRAGVTADAISAYRCELERDDGVMQYEISFCAGGYEYEVSIHAVTGTVLQYEKDRD